MSSMAAKREGGREQDRLPRGASLDAPLAKSLNHFAAMQGLRSVESILALQRSDAGRWTQRQFQTASFQPRLYWLDRD